MNRFTIACLTLLVLLTGCAQPAPQAPPPPPPFVQPPTPPPPPPPEPAKAILEPAQVSQGDFVTLRLDKPALGPVRVTVDGLEDQPKTYLHQGKAVALIGFPAAAKTGSYPVTVTWADGKWQGTIEVVRKKFTEDRLVVTEQQKEIYFDPRQDLDWARVFASRGTSHSSPLWSGPFRVPLDGNPEITTYFGEIRFVNGVETGRHSGMDFGVPTGTPILAPAAGKVVLADHLIVTGWTVIIDHGMNLFTVYYHAEKLGVKPGDYVELGQQIATVGSTGFSTGPHLHWTATIGNTPVDPWPLTKGLPLGMRADEPTSTQ